MQSYLERWRTILRRLTRFTGSSTSARDLLQSALLKAEVSGKARSIDNFDAYVARTALNLAIDERRREITRSRFMVELQRDTLEIIADDRPLQDEVYELKERLSRVKDAIGRLPPRCREALLLHRLGEMKYSEIATHMGISQSAVEKLIARATDQLVRQVEGLSE